MTPSQRRETVIKEYTETQEQQRREHRNELQRQRRARNLDGWKNLNIDNTIISQMGLRNKNPYSMSDDMIAQIKKASANVRRRRTIKANQEIRRQRLLDYGYTPEQIEYSWINSDKKMYEMLNKTNPHFLYHANQHLAIAFTNLQGFEAFYGTSEYRDKSFDEILQAIQKRVDEAKNDPEGSGYLRCVFQIFSGTETECQENLDDWNRRGYNLPKRKLTDRRYYPLLNRNDWTMREFAELTLCIVNQSHNGYVPETLQQLKKFVDDSGLPFGEIFYNLHLD